MPDEPLNSPPVPPPAQDQPSRMDATPLSPGTNIHAVPIPNEELLVPAVQAPAHSSGSFSSGRRIGGKKIILVALLFFLLIGGFLFVNQQQSINDIRNRAANDLYPTGVTIPVPGGATNCSCTCPYGYSCNGMGASIGNGCYEHAPTSCTKHTGTPTTIENPVAGAPCGSADSRGACGQGGCGPGAQRLCSYSNGGFFLSTSCVISDACSDQRQTVSDGGSCTGLKQLSGGEPSNGKFVGCQGSKNCFCTSLTSGTVRCIDDYQNDSCGAPGLHPATTAGPNPTTVAIVPPPPPPPPPPVAPPPPPPPPPVAPPPPPPPPVAPPPPSGPTHTPTPTPTHISTPTPTPTLPPGVTPTNTPIPTPTPTLPPGVTPTNTPTPTPTPIPPVGCNYSCADSNGCQAGMVCTGGYCRNPQCSSSTSCICSSTPTPTPVPNLSYCNYGCTVNTDCTSGLVCVEGSCRNPSCTEKTTCQCDIAESTPKPSMPVSGTGPSVLGASIVAGGLLFLLLGLAL